MDWRRSYDAIDFKCSFHVNGTMNMGAICACCRSLAYEGSHTEGAQQKSHLKLFSKHSINPRFSLDLNVLFSGILKESPT